MFRLPSLQHEYDEHCTLDPAFIQAPTAPGPDATPEERLAFEEKLEDHTRRVKVARETGDWSELRLDGSGEPTKFRLRNLPGDVFRKIVDMVNDGSLGGAMSNTVLLQAALVGVSNLPGVKEVKPTNHPILGKIANTEIPNLLDRVDPRIVAELGAAIRERAMGVRPLS